MPTRMNVHSTEPRGHVADRQLLVPAPHDRDDHDRGADVRDDQQQLQERAEEDPVVVPGTRDVANRIVEHRLIEQQRRDRRDERDEVEHAEPARSLLIAETPLNPFRASGHAARSRHLTGQSTNLDVHRGTV